MLKLVIRGLPPTLSEEDFIEALRVAFHSGAAEKAHTEANGKPDAQPIRNVVWMSYMQGKQGSQRVRCSRAYVAVASASDVAAVHAQMDGRLFVSARGAFVGATLGDEESSTALD